MNSTNPTMLFVIAVCLVSGCSDPAEKVHKTAGAQPQSAAAPAPDNAREHVIRTAQSTIGFVGSKVTGKHDGGFKNFAGRLLVDNGKLVGTPEIKINMGSIWTDNPRLTGHLKSPDFFDVQNFPTTTFTVTGLEPAGQEHKVTGNLNLHGVTKSIEFPARIQAGGDSVTVNAEFAINRKDFNINYPGKPNDLIRDNVVIRLDIKATPGAPGPEDQLTN